MSVDREYASEHRIDWIFLGVLGCFVLSGFAALLYQIAWMRQFSFVFGTSELAVATVLASYMAGLAAGSAVAARFVTSVRRPVLTYGLLELGVALGALAVPFALTAIRQWHVAWFGGQPEPPSAGGGYTALFYLLCAFVLLAIPTGCMGATLPMLTRYAVRTRDQIGSRVGFLYAMNTLGAVLGTLAAAFLLLPVLGLWNTLVAGAAVNLVVFVIAVMISRTADQASAKPEGPAPDETKYGTELPELEPTGLLPPGWVLPLMLLSGSVAFTYEVVWTRLLAFVLGGSVAAFAIMLATFLVGIAVGSAVASPFATGRDRSAKGLVIAQIGTALLSIAVFWALENVLASQVAEYMIGGALNLSAKAMIAGLLMLPATICIGSTFPFAVRVLARDESDAAKAAARVYAWNTVGAIAGAILAGFLLLPLLKFEYILRITVGINLLLAIGAWCLRGHASRLQLGTTVVIAAATLILFQPGPPIHLLSVMNLPGSQGDDDNPSSPGELMFYEVGRSATVALFDNPNGSILLRSNGLPEATITSRGSWPESVRLLTVLPLLQRPEARDMLFVGLGGGSVVSSVPPSVESIDVVELEPKVVEANEFIRDFRYPTDPTSDERVNIIINDARSALEMTDKKYDVIVSQPSHPWTAGASHLYTREFFQLAREHLHPGGVYLQWMNAEFIDVSLFKSLGATLLDQFSYVEMYQPIKNLILFLASEEPLEPERGFANPADLTPDMRDFYYRMGVYHASDLVAWLSLDLEGLMEVCQGAPINTDDFNILATRSRASMMEPLALVAFDFFSPYDPLINPGVRQRLEENASIDWDYIVRRLITMGNASRADDLSKSFDVELDRTLGLAWRLPREEKVDFLDRVIELDPGHETARYALIIGHRDTVADGTAPEDIVAHTKKLTGTSTAVLEAWKLEHEEQWDQIAELDARLAEVPPTSIAFAEAVRLRAKWRVNRDGTADEKRQWGTEVIRIIDLAWRCDPIIVEAGVSLRLTAATNADMPYYMMETARFMARSLMTENVVASPQKLRDLRDLFGDLATRVEQLEREERLSKERAHTVVAQLDKKVGELSYYVRGE